MTQISILHVTVFSIPSC